MFIILNENISGLGKKGEKVKVKPGYARNFLVPKKKAFFYNYENKVFFDQKIKKKNLEENKLYKIATDKMQQIKKLKIVIFSKCNKKNELYGSIKKLDILNYLDQKNIKINNNEIIFPKKKINKIGVYKISFILHSKLNFSTTFEVNKK